MRTNPCKNQSSFPVVERIQGAVRPGIGRWGCMVSSSSSWWVSNVDFALFHTTYPCWLSLNMPWCHVHLFPQQSLPCLCTYMWGGDFKVRARSCWWMGVCFLLSNISIVWQKSLSTPLITKNNTKMTKRTI